MKLKIFKFLVSLLTVLFFAEGCSGFGTVLSKNQVKRGTFVVKNGVFEEKKWDEELKFQRISWFQELNLVYDLLILRFPKNSPFRSWFSSTEDRDLEQCASFLVTIHYNWGSHKISRGTFRDQMEEQGVEEIYIPDFANNLKLHPAMDEQNFQRYRTIGYCQKKGEGPITVTYPGYQTVHITP